MTAHRKLSVHVEHELLLKLETAGIDDVLAQKIIESRNNKLAMEFVNSLRSKQTFSWQEARVSMGKKNFFGPEEWTKFFGKKFQLTTIPEIPWSQSELENPGINQKHFLFLGIDNMDGKPLNILAWHKVYSGEDHPKFYLDWHFTNKFTQVSCELRGYLMPVGIVEGSRGLLYEGQMALLPDEYEVPTAPARATANVLYYLLNKKYLDMGNWSCTSDKSDGGDRVYIQGHSDIGLVFYCWIEDTVDDAGLTASRKS